MFLNPQRTHEFPQIVLANSVQRFGQLYLAFIHTYKYEYIYKQRALL